ncbi:unnamed protein product [Acanthoscelides obtectus]|uniref:Peptidase M14 domain-containing protein n=1 Tax=Acanthoscelides obtectus TaxID=200917 RepID=A0A9P0KF61_ACAOB|nr:unnamed protein product [Acanthoscelides obtectus]CAK1640007.1 hypothetical protein AOBTE_LOCUS11502 [Acanthoscelides obtectus]
MRSPRKIVETTASCVGLNKPKIEVQRVRNVVRRHQKYHETVLNYGEIKSFLQKLQKEYKGKIEIETIGKSCCGRPILMAKIRGYSGCLRRPKSYKTFIEAGSCGYSWSAVSTALYLIEYATKGNDLTVLSDYYIVPCSNPDGYQNSLDCLSSVDLTFNYPIVLGCGDVQNIPENQFMEAVTTWRRNYRYRSPETEALKSTLLKYKDHIKLFISLQEGPNTSKILYPFGNTVDEVDHIQLVRKVAMAGRHAAKRLMFQVGSIIEVSGMNLGCIIDYMQLLDTQPGSPLFPYIVRVHNNGKRPHKCRILAQCQEIKEAVKGMASNVFMILQRYGY